MAMDITLIVRTLTPVVKALEQLAIPYHIGGSVASSRYGELRPTQDVDLLADLLPSDVRSARQTAGRGLLHRGRRGARGDSTPVLVQPHLQQDLSEGGRLSSQVSCVRSGRCTQCQAAAAGERWTRICPGFA